MTCKFYKNHKCNYEDEQINNKGNACSLIMMDMCTVYKQQKLRVKQGRHRRLAITSPQIFLLVISFTLILLCLPFNNVGVADTPMFFEVNPNTIFLSDPSSPFSIFLPELNMEKEGFCGTVESLDQIGVADAELWVHTKNDVQQGQMITFKFIHETMYLEETRSIHLGYLAIPTLRVYRDNEWNEGIKLGGVFVPENTQCPYISIGQYGYGLALKKDTIVPFQTVMYIYEQDQENPNYFHKYSESNSTGLWFYDIPPYFELHSKASTITLEREELIL